MRKRIFSLIISFCIICVALFNSPTMMVQASSYASDYRYWSQGGSDDADMRGYGCWVVAQAKLIYEANINRSSSFNPDAYLQWERNNGYINSEFYQVNGANAPVAYANAVGKSLNYLGYWDASDDQLWFNINAGYYTIVYVSGTNAPGGHYVLIANELSKQKGQLYCYDSWTTTGSVQPQLITRYGNHNGGYVYSANNPVEGTPGALTISAKSSYYSTEDVVVSWNTPSNTAKYGFTLRHNPSTGDLVDHYVTGNSYNLGKLAAGNYRLWMAPYNSSGTRGTAVYVDFTVVSHSHSYTSKITKNPTCAATGVRTYTCACGSSYTETIAKTAHKLSYKVTKAATCVTTGIGTYTCTCGLSYTETIAKTSHTAVTDAAVAATCTQAGKTAGSHCKVCNTVIKKQETIPAKGHTIVTDAAVAATCTQAGKTAGSHCKVCNLVVKKQEIIPRKPHNYTSQITKATTKKNGSISSVCSTCGTKDTSTIYMPKKLELSKKNCEYTGKACKPSVVVKDSKGNVIDSSNYTITYSKNKSVGKASVKVTFKGDAYSGNLQQTFTITPKKTSISKVTAKSKGFSLQWKMQKTQVTGYEIQYSTNKSFTKGTTKTVTVEKNTTKAKTISKLKAKQKYYVKVRTYKTVKVNGKNTKIYSEWSKAKAVTTKK